MFDEVMWKQLTAVAKERKASVGELVRSAVITVYINTQQTEKEKRRAAFDSINKIRSQIKHKFRAKEIKELINYGRKY